MNILLQRQQYLVGIHWLNEIVGYLTTDGLIHDILFLTLRNHYYRNRRCNLLDTLQGVKS